MAFNEKQKEQMNLLWKNPDEFKIQTNYSSISGFLYQYFMDGDGFLDLLWKKIKDNHHPIHCEIFNLCAQKYPKAFQDSARGKSTIESKLKMELDDYNHQKINEKMKILGYEEFIQYPSKEVISNEDAQYLYQNLKKINPNDLKVIQYDLEFLKEDVELKYYDLQEIFFNSMLTQDLNTLKVVVEKIKKSSEYLEYLSVAEKIKNNEKNIYSKFEECIKNNMSFFDYFIYHKRNDTQVKSLYQTSLELLTKNKEHREIHDYLKNELKIDVIGRYIKMSYQQNNQVSVMTTFDKIINAPEMKLYFKEYWLKLSDDEKKKIFFSNDYNIYIKSHEHTNFSLFVNHGLFQELNDFYQILNEKEKVKCLYKLYYTDFDSDFQKRFEVITDYIFQQKNIKHPNYYFEHLINDFYQINFEKISSKEKNQLFNRFFQFVEQAKQDQWTSISYGTIFKNAYFKNKEIQKIINPLIDFKNQHYNLIETFQTTTDEKILQSMSDMIEEHPNLLFNKTTKKLSGFTYLVEKNLLNILTDDLWNKISSDIRFETYYNQVSIAIIVEKLLTIDFNFKEIKENNYGLKKMHLSYVFEKLENIELLNKVYEKEKLDILQILDSPYMKSIFDNDAIYDLLIKKYQLADNKEFIKIKLSEQLFHNIEITKLHNKLFNHDGYFNEVLLTQNNKMNVLHHLCKELKTDASKSNILDNILTVLLEIEKFPEGNILLKQKFKREQPLTILLKSCSLLNKKNDRLINANQEKLKKCVNKMLSLNNQFDDMNLGLIDKIIDKENLENFFPRIKDELVFQHLNYNLEIDTGIVKKAPKI